MPPSSAVQDAYLAEWYGAKKYHAPKLHGLTVAKPPDDLWRYLEIIEATKPDVIIECGTFHGGSAAWFSACQRIAGIMPNVVTIDVTNTDTYDPWLGVTALKGSSVDHAVFVEVKARTAGAQRVMVSLDSDHSATHVYAELDTWYSLVTPGCYLVVEDTCVNGHPLLPEFGAGPTEALAAWLPLHPEFEADRDIEERHGITLMPGGWLRRAR